MPSLDISCSLCIAHLRMLLFNVRRYPAEKANFLVKLALYYLKEKQVANYKHLVIIFQY